jgi:hypothetical protein
MSKEREIFYPNKLTVEELENLEGWKLKVATVHFGKTRQDCQRLGYGYERKQRWNDDKPEIYLVADKDGVWTERQEVSLENELDWDNEKDLLSECGYNIPELYRQHIATELGFELVDNR